MRCQGDGPGPATDRLIEEYTEKFAHYDYAAAAGAISDE